MLPRTDIFKNFVDLDEQGYILTDENMETSVPGVFACGDVRRKNVRQIANAVGDGAVAAVYAEKYIASLNE
jgi:thioredoxin reductase (NADPH)